MNACRSLQCYVSSPFGSSLTPIRTPEAFAKFEGFMSCGCAFKSTSSTRTKNFHLWGMPHIACYALMGPRAESPAWRSTN
jgi:hypothetical protein